MDNWHRVLPPLQESFHERTWYFSTYRLAEATLLNLKFSYVNYKCNSGVMEKEGIEIV